MLFSHLDKDCFGHFLQGLQQHLSRIGIDKPALLVGDGATAHTAQHWGQHPAFHWQKQPTACPELNPVERFFQELRRHTAKMFKTLEEIETKICQLVQEYSQLPQKVTMLTAYPYIKCTVDDSY